MKKKTPKSNRIPYDEVYGSCSKCKINFQYGDKFLNVQKFDCCTSQGYSCVYVESEITLCVKCVKKI